MPFSPTRRAREAYQKAKHTITHNPFFSAVRLTVGHYLQMAKQKAFEKKTSAMSGGDEK
jgi:hypothetical protein